MDWNHFSNPQRSSQDVADALDHMQDFSDHPLRLDQFKVIGPIQATINKLSYYDDLSSWSEWSPGELAEMNIRERRAALDNFRGSSWAARAVQWTQHTVPPIVVVDALPDLVGIGDGRGRVSYAIGMGWKTLPVIFLRKK
jgi:hypothetical protein